MAQVAEGNETIRWPTNLEREVKDRSSEDGRKASALIVASYLYVIDDDSLLPEGKVKFDSRLFGDEAAAEYLKSAKLWFWHFTRRHGPSFSRLDRIATMAGLTGEPGYSLVEREVKTRAAIKIAGPHHYLVIRNEGPCELLTAKQ